MDTRKLLTGASIGIVSVAIAAGCERETPQPGGAGSGGQGGALSNLSDQPTSMYGKSALAGKNAADKVAQQQAGAAGVADEMSGQGAAVQLGGLVWTAPTAWERVEPPRNMWMAEFRIPGAETGGDGVVGFAYYGADKGGNVQMNIDRWVTLVTDPSGGRATPAITRKTIAGFPVTLVSMDGTYRDGMMTQSPTMRPGYSFRGVIAEGSQGSVFIRLHGPRETVAAVAPEWNRLVDGMRRQ